MKSYDILRAFVTPTCEMTMKPARAADGRQSEQVRGGKLLAKQEGEDAEDRASVCVVSLSGEGETQHQDRGN